MKNIVQRFLACTLAAMTILSMVPVEANAAAVESIGQSISTGIGSMTTQDDVSGMFSGYTVDDLRMADVLDIRTMSASVMATGMPQCLWVGKSQSETYAGTFVDVWNRACMMGYGTITLMADVLGKTITGSFKYVDEDGSLVDGYEALDKFVELKMLGFGSPDEGDAFLPNGSLLVPSWADITLDLAGHVMYRNAYGEAENLVDRTTLRYVNSNVGTANAGKVVYPGSSGKETVESIAGVDSNGGPMFTVEGNLTINDSGGGSIHRAVSTGDYTDIGMLYGAVNVKGKPLYGNQSYYSRVMWFDGKEATQYEEFDKSTGGAIYVTDGGSVVMNGGAIRGNIVKIGMPWCSFYDDGRGDSYYTNKKMTDAFGAGVYVDTGGEFIMNNGIISGNSIEVVNTVRQEYRNVHISGKPAPTEANGGGIYVANGSNCVLNSGYIYDNSAPSHGGGVYVESGASVTVSSSMSITDNVSGQEDDWATHLWNRYQNEWSHLYYSGLDYTKENYAYSNIELGSDASTIKLKDIENVPFTRGIGVYSPSSNNPNMIVSADDHTLTDEELEIFFSDTLTPSLVKNEESNSFGFSWFAGSKPQVKFKWNDDSRIISLDTALAPAENSPIDASYYSNLEAMFSAAKPSEFSGWWTAIVSGSKKDKNSTYMTSSSEPPLPTILYPHWLGDGIPDFVIEPSAAYKIEYYKWDGAKYQLQTGDTETLSASIDSSVTIDLEDGEFVSKYPGFHVSTKPDAGHITEGIAAANGSLVLKVYYDPNVYTVNIQLGEGESMPGSQPTTIQVEPGTTIDTITKPVKTGYTFAQWKYVSGGSGMISPGTQIPGDITIQATWTGNSGISYTVEHYLQNENGIGYASPVQTNHTGTAGQTVAATADTQYTNNGFTVNSGSSTMSGILAGDGSTVLKIYYDRKQYQISIVINSSDPGMSDSKQTILHGAKLQTPSTPTKTGYAFQGWYKHVGSSDGFTWNEGLTPYDFSQPVTESFSLMAGWKAGEYNYTVKHHFQDVTGNGYTVETSTQSGSMDETVRVDPLTREGFTFDQDNPSNVTSITINSTGTQELHLYYDRNVYTITKDIDGSTSQEQLRHGTSFDLIEAPTKTGYQFVHWTENGIPIEPGALVTKTTTIKAVFEPEMLDITFNLMGATGTGYGKTYQIPYDSTMDDLMDMLEESGVANPTMPFKSFAGWATTNSADEPLLGNYKFTSNVTLYPVWVDGKKVDYQIQHWFEGEDGTYALDSTQTQVIKDQYVGQSVTGEYGDYSMYQDVRYESYPGHPDTVSSLILQDVGPGEMNTLKLYYRRNRCEVTVIANNGSYLNPQGDVYKEQVPYGTEFEQPDVEFPGHTLYRWLNGSGNIARFPAKITGNVTFEAEWHTRQDLTYKIDVYFQNETDDGYTQGESVTIDGATAGTKADATQVGPYTGFQFDEDNPKNVLTGWVADDNVIVSEEGGTEQIQLAVYFNRVEHTVTIRPVDPREDDSIEVIVQTVRHGATATEPDEVIAPNYRPGYLFTGWTSGGTSFTFNTPIESDMTITGVWEASDGVQYQIWHHKQSVDGTNYNDVEKQTLAGTADETVTAAPKSYTGFHLNVSHTDSVTSGTVDGNGTLVLHLYYDRDTHTVTTDVDGETETAFVLYGAKFSKPSDPAKTGYKFAGWVNAADNSPFDFNAPITQDVTIKATWTASDDVVYTVEHYTEDLEGDTYSIYETETLEGVTGATVTANWKSIPGFVQSSHPENITSGIVQGDGSLTLKFYYDRKVYTVTVNIDGETSETQVFHGAKFDRPADPEKSGYTFVGWIDTATNRAFDFNKLIEKNVTIRAEWSVNQNVAYTVTHYTENLNSDEYSVYHTEHHTGTTGEKVTATWMSIPGFTQSQIQMSVDAGTIQGDGSLVLTLYYDRKVYGVDTDGDGEDDVTIEHGDTDGLNRLPIPSRPGYDFGGWVDDTGNHVDFEEEVVGSIRPEWIPRDDTRYTIRHYQQNVTGNEYTLIGTTSHEGTTESLVNAINDANDYLGFYLSKLNTETKAASLPGLTILSGPMPMVAGEAGSNQGTIAGDGSLVLNLYYDRKEITVRVPNGDGGYDDTVIRFGDIDGLDSIDPHTPEGYEFIQWVDSDNQVVDFTKEVNGIVTPEFTMTDTTYTVERYHQTVDGKSYELIASESIESEVGEYVHATVLKYTGFTYDANDPRQIAAGYVTMGEPLVLKLYYDRFEIPLHIGVNGDYDQDSVLFGDNDGLDDIYIPEIPGYTFVGWVDANGNDADFSNPDEKGFYTYYEPNDDVVYKVQHYQQDLDGKDYTLFETEEFEGTTGKTVKASANDYLGFQLAKNSKSVSGVIAGDGTTVLKVYYDRQELTVRIDTPNDDDPIEHEILFGDLDALDALKKKYGNLFGEAKILDSWVDESNEIVDFEDEVDGVITPHWIDNPDYDGDEIIIDTNTPTGVPNTGITDNSGLWLLLSVLCMLMACASGAYVIVLRKRKS